MPHISCSIPPNPHQAHELYDVIRTPEKRDSFLRYLQAQCCAENLLFWEAVERIKAIVAMLARDPDDKGAYVCVYVRVCVRISVSGLRYL